MKFFASSTCIAALLFVASVASADPVGGPSGGLTMVRANSANVHKVLYRGGEQADFAIKGDGDTTLNLVVRDAAGNEIVRTRGPGDRAHVYWRPTQTGYFYISVVNEGRTYNQYGFRAY
jgi:hypothetical protein